MKLLSLLAAIVLGILLPAVAAAGPSSADRATARALALEGEAALASKDYATAADRYTRAEALFHAPTLLLGLARAQVGLGKLVDAQETYRRVATEAVAPNASPAFVEAVATAQKELSAVTPRIAWLTVSVTGAASATVRLDEAILPPASLGARRAVDPGKHTIVVQGEGGLVKRASVTLAEGKTETIVLELTPQEGAPPPPRSTAPVVQTLPPPVRSTEPAPRRSRAAAYALIGIGGASAVVGAVFTGLTASSYSAFNAHPTKDGADRTVLDARIADGTFVSAAVLGAAGLVVLLVTRGPESPKAPPGAPAAGRRFVTPRVGTTVGGLSSGLQF